MFEVGFSELIPHFLSEIIAIVLLGVLILGRYFYGGQFRRSLNFWVLVVALVLDIIGIFLHGVLVFGIFSFSPYWILFFGTFIFMAYFLFCLINWKYLGKVIFGVFLIFYAFSFTYEILVHLFDSYILGCCGHFAETLLQVSSYFLVMDIFVGWRRGK